MHGHALHKLVAGLVRRTWLLALVATLACAAFAATAVASLVEASYLAPAPHGAPLPAPVVADKPVAKEEPVKPVAQAEKPKQAAVGAPRIPNPRRWKEDARHCLDRPTNTEVIKCADNGGYLRVTACQR